LPVIHLVRHGQASADAADYDVLSQLGDQQARAAGRELVRRGLRDPLVLCGDLVRQRDTAKALIGAAGVTVVARIDPRWNEYDHLGLLTRYPTSAATVQDHLDYALAAWIEDPHGGWNAFQSDAVEALNEIPAKGRDAVVVTSGGVIAALCGFLLGLPAAGVVALNRVTVNTGITTLIHGSRGINLVTFNDHAHLAADRSLLTYR
jgi:broad specificity phosphatase PhoE